MRGLAPSRDVYGRQMIPVPTYPGLHLQSLVTLEYVELGLHCKHLPSASTNLLKHSHFPNAALYSETLGSHFKQLPLLSIKLVLHKHF